MPKADRIMKKIFSIMFLGLILAVSCQKEGVGGLNEISDLYSVPEGAVEMSNPTATSTWSTDRRYFDLSFGNDLTTTLVGYDAFLAPGQYILGADEVGKAVLAKTKVKGQAAKAGYITVGRRDATYQVSALIDGIALTWKGSLPFKADPDPTALIEVMQAQSNLANGVNSVTLQLGTGGVKSEFSWTTFENVWIGQGNFLALDLYSEDGYLHDGSYTASAQGGVIEANQFGIGWDNEEMGDWGKDWGTCWWTVADGAATATKITGGLVAVSSREEDDATIWTITWGEKYPKEVVFEGEIKALTKPKKPVGPVVPDYLYTDAVTPGDALDLHAVTITDKDGNELAYLELQTEPGATELTGSYPSTSYASEPGQMRDGYFIDLSAWGMEGTMEGGSYYMKDGEKQFIGAGTATVVVTKIAEGAYDFTCEFFSYAAAGPDYVPEEGGGEEGDDDVTGDVVLKLTSGLTYSMEDVTAANTAADGSALSGMTLWRVTVSDGAGTVAAFDLGTSAGSSDLAGTYTVMSYPDAVGKAGNGWGWLPYMVGGCYFVVDGEYYFIPADATINVSNNSDGTIKVKFEGPVQKSDNSDGGQGGLLLNNVAKS